MLRILNVVRLAVLARLAVALDRASQAVAFDEEANAHYGLDSSRIYQIRCWTKGFVSGLFQSAVKFFSPLEEARRGEFRE